jgi:hypothetical protein
MQNIKQKWGPPSDVMPFCLIACLLACWQVLFLFAGMWGWYVLNVFPAIDAGFRSRGVRALITGGPLGFENPGWCGVGIS